MQALLLLSAVLAVTVFVAPAPAGARRHKVSHHDQKRRHRTPQVVASPPCSSGLPTGSAPEDPNIIAAARQDARQLVRAFIAPPRAARAGDPSAHLGGTTSCPDTPNLASFYDLWRAKGDMQSVIDWIKGHPPRGSVTGGSSQSAQCPPAGQGAPCRITSESVAFTWPPVPGVSSQRTLWVSAAPLAGGKTGLRVVSQVIWLSARPSTERVPAGVSSVSVYVTNANGSTSGPYNVSDPSKIDQIIGLTDSLPVAQPGVQACPADYGGAVRVIFKAGDGTTLAEADAEPGGCGLVMFSVKGQQQPPLSGAQGYIQQLEPIVGFTMSSPTP